MSETERLIEFVKERQFLYDINDVNYKNRPKRLEAWKEIAREMGAGNASVWSSKWKGLKDNFAKFKKTTNPTFAQMYKKYKNWPWAEYMRFLDNCNSTNNKRGCTLQSSYVRPRTREPTLAPKLPSVVQFYIADTNKNSSMGEINRMETDGLENLTNESIKEHIQNRSELAPEVPENVTIKNNQEKPPLDGTDHFFLSYAQTFKNLPSRMQIMLKLEIATLFSRYELQAEGVTKELFDSIPRIVPHPVKFEYDFVNTIDD